MKGLSRRSWFLLTIVAVVSTEEVEKPRSSSVQRPARLLVAPAELEEQRGCSVLAFREWLAPLAAKTKRALVVPQRFATLFNFSIVAAAWYKKQMPGLFVFLVEFGLR